MMSEYLHGTTILGSSLGTGYYIGGESRTLRKGMKGEDVRALQQALFDASVDVGGIDGVFGFDTERAVRRFQEANGLTADGVAGPATMAALRAKPGTSMSPIGPSSAAQPPAPSSSVSAPGGSFLTRKYGPLPVYGWVCSATAVGLFAYLVSPLLKK